MVRGWVGVASSRFVILENYSANVCLRIIYENSVTRNLWHHTVYMYSLVPRPSLASYPSLVPRPSLASYPSLVPRPSLASYPSLPSQLFLQPWKKAVREGLGTKLVYTSDSQRQQWAGSPRSPQCSVSSLQREWHPLSP